MTEELLSTLDRSLPPTLWDEFLAQRPNAHIMQHRRWGELKARFGWRVQRVALRRAGSLIAGAQLLLRPLPWGQALAYVPKGPLTSYGDDEANRQLLAALVRLARRCRAAVLMLEPDCEEGPQPLPTWMTEGWRPARPIQPRSTILIDLDGDDETLLARMKPKWRYNVRLAARKGVIVRPGSAADLPAVYALMEETARRDGFAVHAAPYYATAYDLFARDGQAVWWLAEYEGTLLAAIVTFVHGARAWYFWGASASVGRNLMPNHALQWAALRWARARGCRSYDLWGIPDEVGEDPAAYAGVEPERQGGLWGVYRFKQGWGGRIVRFVGAWELPLSAPGYTLYRLATRLRRSAP